MYRPLRALTNCIKSIYRGESIYPVSDRRTGLYEALLTTALLVAGISTGFPRHQPRPLSDPQIETVPIYDTEENRVERIPEGPPETTADILLDDFPAEIPGARSVVKYGKRGSAYCLVHVRQFHFIGERFGEEMGAVGGEWTKRLVSESTAEAHLNVYDVLENISKILGHLYGRGFRSDYLESVLPEEEEAYNRLRETFRQGYVDGGEDFAKNFDPPANPKRPWLDRNFFVTVLRTTGNGLLEIRGAEDKETNHRPGEELIRYTKWRLQRIQEGEKFDGIPRVPVSATEPREDVLLELVSKGEVLAITVYGGFHNWRNNVDRWREPASLIEITPENFK